MVACLAFSKLAQGCFENCLYSNIYCLIIISFKNIRTDIKLSQSTSFDPILFHETPPVIGLTSFHTKIKSRTTRCSF